MLFTTSVGLLEMILLLLVLVVLLYAHVLYSVRWSCSITRKATLVRYINHKVSP